MREKDECPWDAGVMIIRQGNGPMQSSDQYVGESARKPDVCMIPDIRDLLIRLCRGHKHSFGDHIAARADL